MSFFNKISLTLLNYAQRVVTTTVGNNIGINDIFQQIEANFDDIKRVLDPNIGGGGLDGSNFKPNSITSDAIKLNSYKFSQTGGINNFVNMNGIANFSPANTIANGSFVLKTDKNILITSNMQHKVHVDIANNLVNIQHWLQISTVNNFSSKTFERLRTIKAHDRGNGVWTNGETIISEVVTLKAGTYFARIAVSADGNTQSQIETTNSTLSIVEL
jgi:hypothetical protein